MASESFTACGVNPCFLKFCLKIAIWSERFRKVTVIMALMYPKRLKFIPSPLVSGHQQRQRVPSPTPIRCSVACKLPGKSAMTVWLIYWEIKVIAKRVCSNPTRPPNIAILKAAIWKKTLSNTLSDLRLRSAKATICWWAKETAKLKFTTLHDPRRPLRRRLCFSSAASSSLASSIICSKSSCLRRRE